MASLLSLWSEAWIWATSFEALAAHASRAFASALFASVIFAESFGVMKLTTTRFELATVTAAFSATSSALILSTKACCSGGRAGPKKPPPPRPPRPPVPPGPPGSPGARAKREMPAARTMSAAADLSVFAYFILI